MEQTKPLSGSTPGKVEDAVREHRPSPRARGARRGLSLTAALGLCLAVSLGGCAWLADKQRELVYRPTPGSFSTWAPVSANDVPLWLTQPVSPSSSERIRAIWMPQPDPKAPAVLYLHGTFRNVFQNRPKIVPIFEAGYSVLAVDYRGWGESTDITPSEATIMADAEVAWAEFAWRVPEAQRRVIYGHSMGSGVAVELARRHQGTPARRQYGALVLEAAFTSLPDVASDYGGVGKLGAWLTTERFASLDKIKALTVPKWFVVGTDDNTVPPKHSQRLFDAAPEPKSLIVFEGGSHSRLQDKDPAKYRQLWTDIATWLRVGTNASAAAR